MRSYLKIIILILTILLFSACTSKRTITIHNSGTLRAITVGDYEITQMQQKLAHKLDIPIQQDNLLIDNQKALDEITLMKIDNALYMILSGKIFQKNSPTPIDNAIYIVEDISEILQQYPHIIIQVTGHSDRDEDSKKYQELSDNRAFNIASIFYQHDLKNEIFAKGCAENRPLFNSSHINELSNARVEIYLYANKSKMLDHCKN